MSDTGNVQQNEDRELAVKHAAEELATRLKTLADTLSANAKARRFPYGPGRVGPRLRRQSPEGYLLDPASLTVLLPDGRVWQYSGTEAVRFPTGRFYDARADYPEFAGGRSFPGGREFAFLGATLDKYSFGWAAPDDTAEPPDPGGLRAIYGDGRLVSWASADEAFALLTEAALARQI